MKFDTKTASPLPFTTSTASSTAKSDPDCYLKVNKYIPCEQMPVAVTPTSDKLGRELFYEPHIFFSPVLASQRVVEDRQNMNYNDDKSNKNSTTPAKKRLMTASGVDDLTQQLDALCLGGALAVANNNKKEKETVELTTKTPTPTASPKSVSFEIGRFDQSIYSPKIHCHVTVKRSCRLAALSMK